MLKGGQNSQPKFCLDTNKIENFRKMQHISARKSTQPCNQWLEESYPKVRKVIPMYAKRALRKVCSLRKSKKSYNKCLQSTCCRQAK